MSLVNTLKEHTHWVNSISFSTHGKYLVSGGGDRDVIIWNMANYKPIKTLRNQVEAVVMVSFSKDGNTIFTGYDNVSVRAWNVETGAQIKTFKVTDFADAELVDLGLFVTYRKKKITLTQISTNSADLTFEIRVPHDVKKVSLNKSAQRDKVILTVVSQNSVIFYSKLISAPLKDFCPYEMYSINQHLSAEQMYLQEATISSSNNLLLQQLGADGTAKLTT